jgi:NAD+ diphosphatase
MASSSQTFAGSPLDRAANARRDPALVADLLRRDDCRVLPLWQLKGLVTDSARPALAWQPVGAIPPEGDHVLLGLESGAPRFACAVAGETDPAESGPLAGRGTFTDVRAAASMIPGPESAILAQARALLDWHARHGFCAVCGAPTRMGEAGYLRACTEDSCKAQHFPRTDPVVIMLVSRGDRCLLGRNRRFPTRRRYSALAGFVEPGESIEEAVRREVLEEAGIRVGDVTYFASQPWPFPSNLMIGCFGEALTEEIRIDPSELQDALWLPRADVRACFSGDGATADGRIEIPPADAIAHHLLKTWADVP